MAASRGEAKDVRQKKFLLIKKLPTNLGQRRNRKPNDEYEHPIKAAP
jgi:hypothetical protein